MNAQDPLVTLLDERYRQLDSEFENLKAEVARIQERLDNVALERDYTGRLLALRRPGSEEPPAKDGEQARTLPVEMSADLVVELLEQAGTAMHYREIYDRIQKRGFKVGGQDPANTLLARYYNDPRLYRPQRGYYDLASRRREEDG
jgi:hypothetical protein